MSENYKDFIYNILTNTLRSGTELHSAIYLVDVTKTNESSADLKKAACCNNYYSVLAHDERYNADTKIAHTNQTTKYIPYTGVNMVYNDYPNRDAAVDEFV